MEEKIKAYMKEIAEVSKRHGLFLSACNCCGSIDDITGKSLTPNENICFHYNEDTDTYETN